MDTPKSTIPLLDFQNRKERRETPTICGERNVEFVTLGWSEHGISSPKKFHQSFSLNKASDSLRTTGTFTARSTIFF